MNKQQILESKIAQLCGEQYVPIDSAGEALIEQNPELKQEIAFLEAIWHPNTVSLQQPSADLDLGFYKMLASAQSAQARYPSIPTAESSAVSTKVDLLFSRIKRWFTPQHIAQFASLVVVFMLGFYLNSSESDRASSLQLDALNEQVSSLNTMMAISLLQQPNASERLAGVAFTQKANLHHQELSNLMLQTLRNDSATPVKLAIINALSANAIDSFELALLEIIQAENNVLVQIELSRLLYSQGSPSTIQALLELGKQEQLHPDLRQWINDIKATAST
ncbi:hypothetical protein [Aliiglaciecola sp. M165]|uniref:hypothetical protein n=1 Tax=Aliiglaciecola sp. M165 TaxID=2593649 RepID=UPI00117C5D45|nr:hypothetical protein [Aliiglaciecola sp. M165]TRY31792.1 hypothetical protein FM019_08070 [Aliiglaciecola sp. M165]